MEATRVNPLDFRIFEYLNNFDFERDDHFLSSSTTSRFMLKKLLVIENPKNGSTTFFNYCLDPVFGQKVSGKSQKQSPNESVMDDGAFDPTVFQAGLEEAKTENMELAPTVDCRH